MSAWCQPGNFGEEQHRVWLVRFDDPDQSDAVFTGPDAETEARAFYEQATATWNCYLFATAPA
jgi:hypothetical protein